MHALRRRLVFLVVFTIAVLAFAQAAHAHGSHPTGNQGSVKVDDDDVDDAPANHPHVICALRIDVDHSFGHPFDIDFDALAPTTRAGDDQHLLVVHVPDGDASGLIDLRAFLGGVVPNPQQGFHIFITVHLPGGDKHKVVWVQLCPPATTTTAKATTTTSTTAATPVGTAVISGSAQTTTTTGVPTQVLGENFVKPAANAAEPTSLANTGNPFSPALAVGLVLTGVSVLGAARRVSGRRLESSMRRVVDKER